MSKNKKNTKPSRPGYQPDRVGLFGGTFNPVHLGHVEIARSLKEGFPLDRILVIPSAAPPHKKVSGIADAKDRLTMARLCFDDLEGFEVSDIELKRTGPSYTIDTINEILSSRNETAETFLMIGSDAFFEIHTWNRFREILERIPLIIMTRPGDDLESPEQKRTRAGKYLEEKISYGYRWNDEFCFFENAQLKRLWFYNVTPLDISSTRIRRDLRNNGCTSDSFLNNEVAAYINQKGLYNEQRL